MVKSCVFSEVRTEFLNIILMSFVWGATFGRSFDVNIGRAA
jgi:hypothetical protein